MRLRELLAEYHPVNQQRARPYPVGPITAPGAEAACEVVRGDIAKNFEGDPVIEFDDALERGDEIKIAKLLNDAWFGVPETTSCWRIPGFREAVDLLEDPPDDEEENEDASR
jgi:hypothetical protein